MYSKSLQCRHGAPNWNRSQLSLDLFVIGQNPIEMMLQGSTSSPLNNSYFLWLGCTFDQRYKIRGVHWPKWGSDEILTWLWPISTRRKLHVLATKDKLIQIIVFGQVASFGILWTSSSFIELLQSLAATSKKTRGYKDCLEKKLTNVFLHLISGPKL